MIHKVSYIFGQCYYQVYDISLLYYLESQVGICKMTSCFGTVSGILAAVLLVLWISIAITAARGNQSCIPTPNAPSANIT